MHPILRPPKALKPAWNQALRVLKLEFEFVSHGEITAPDFDSLTHPKGRMESDFHSFLSLSNEMKEIKNIFFSRRKD